jgi:hypothetical protein
MMTWSAGENTLYFVLAGWLAGWLALSIDQTPCCRATIQIRRKALKNRKEARNCIQSAMTGFQGMCAFATVAELADSWVTIKAVVQPTVPPATPGDDMFHVAGLDPWDAEVVECMLNEGDVSGALAEVNRLVSLAFGSE